MKFDKYIKKRQYPEAGKRKYCFACGNYYNTFVCNKCEVNFRTSYNRLSSTAFVLRDIKDSKKNAKMILSLSKHVMLIPCSIESLIYTIKHVTPMTFNIKIILTIILMLFI